VFHGRTPGGRSNRCKALQQEYQLEFLRNREGVNVAGRNRRRERQILRGNKGIRSWSAWWVTVSLIKNFCLISGLMENHSSAY
jgi:hypothetical protein